jgi:hypothetical protein
MDYSTGRWALTPGQRDQRSRAALNQLGIRLRVNERQWTAEIEQLAQLAVSLGFTTWAATRSASLVEGKS